MFRPVLTTLSKSLTVRRFGAVHARVFSDYNKQTSIREQEAKRLSDQARMSQGLWDFLVPERNIGITHPFFLVLLVLTLSLHFYNNRRDLEEDERLRMKRLSKSNEK